MKIVNIINSPGRGGAEMMLVRLLSEFKQTRCCEPIVISLGGDGPMVEALRSVGISTYILDKRRPSWIIKIIFLIRILRSIKPDLIQSWMYSADMYAIVATRIGGLSNTPVVWNIRSSGPGEGQLRKFRVLLLGLMSKFYPKRIIVCGSKAMEAHLKYFYKKSKMMVIYNGYQFNNFPNLYHQYELNPNGNESSYFTVGCLARFDFSKDHATLFRAIRRLCDLSVRPIRLILAGKGMDTENKQVVAMLRNQNIYHLTELLGELNSTENFFKKINVMCLTSIEEGFPNVLVEAMSANVLVVATAAGEAQLIVNKFGYITNPGDDEGIAKAITSVMELDEENNLKMVNDAREWVVKNFEISVAANKYMDIYTEIIQQH
jgi:glycosyltransferase involved in cell wall biosynthesis